MKPLIKPLYSRKTTTGKGGSPADDQVQPDPGRRRLLFFSALFILGGVGTLAKVLTDFFDYSRQPSGLTPFTLKEPNVFPHFERGVWLSKDKRGLFAFSGTCPHLGCTPVWKAEASEFHCPCHKSVFAADGSRVRGPAPSGLKRVAISRTRDGAIRVDPGREAAASDRLTPKA
jgi:Rieske Fe-S protein